MLASGIAITKKGLRVLTLNSKKGSFEVVEDRFIPIEKDVIVEGQIKNISDFQKTLAKIRQGKVSKIISRSNIHPSISVPEKIVYIDNYQFPIVEEGNLEETVKINIPNILPFAVEDAYFSWQEVGPITQDNYQEIIFSAAKKEDIDPYIGSVTHILAPPLSVETEALAFGRLIQTNGEIIPAIILDDEEFNILIIEKDSLQFSQSYPFEDSKNLTQEISRTLEKVINFYSVETNREIKLTKIYLAGEGADSEKASELAKNLKIEVSLANPDIKIKNLTEPWKKVVALSLALRGFISEKEDTNLTLLPFGTRELYLSKKAVNFFNAAGNIIASFCVALIALFFVTLLIFQFYSLTLSNRLIALSGEVVSPTDVNLEKTAKNFNENVKILTDLETNHYTFVPALEQIRAVASKNKINLSKIVITDYNEPVILSGIAPTRESIIDLKRDFEKSNKFIEIQSPISALEQKTNISFNFLFKIKPETIFLK